MVGGIRKLVCSFVSVICAYALLCYIFIFVRYYTTCCENFSGIIPLLAHVTEYPLFLLSVSQYIYTYLVKFTPSPVLHFNCPFTPSTLCVPPLLLSLTYLSILQ